MLDIVKQSGAALCLLFLAGDLKLNPGPTKSISCGMCQKTIRKNHGFVDCASCKKPFHLKCFGPDLNARCNLCCVVNVSETSSDSSQAFFAS